MEFDTVSETFVGNHQPKVGFGATPEASPDGSHIVLFANDGGQNLRVLRAGVNGQKSTLAFDVDLNFENVPPGLEAISDFVFVNWKGHNLLALATGFDNNLAIVDLSAATPTVSKVSLSSSSAPTGGNGGRMVEWAYGSDYIWVDGSANDEVYVLKLNDDGTVSLERTISNLPSSKIIYVENFAQRANFNLFTTYLADSLKTTTDDSSSAGESSNNNQGNSAQLMADLLASKEEGDDQASTVAIVALVIGSLSLLMNVVGMMIYFSSSNSSGKPFAEPSRAETTERVSDDKTIGSKQVA